MIISALSLFMFLSRLLRMLLTQVVEAETEEERELALDPVQQLVNFVQFANDEGDPGMGLELGMALFCHGGQVA